MVNLKYLQRLTEYELNRHMPSLNLIKYLLKAVLIM